MQHKSWWIQVKIGQKLIFVKNQLRRWILHPRIGPETENQKICRTFNFGQKSHTFLTWIVIFSSKMTLFWLFWLNFINYSWLVSLSIQDNIKYSGFHQLFMDISSIIHTFLSPGLGRTPAVSILVFARDTQWNWQNWQIWLWFHH